MFPKAKHDTKPTVAATEGQEEKFPWDQAAIQSLSFSISRRSKYFRGRRLHGGDYDVKVEQAEFKELSVTANVEGGITASIVLYKTGNKVVRSFKPDFLLVRQNVKDANEDYRNLLLGFQYGNVPGVNSLESIYNFQVKK